MGEFSLAHDSCIGTIFSQVLAYNLKRMINIFGVTRLMKAIAA